MCACVMSTATNERGSNGGSCQLRSRSSLRPWKSPQSTSTRALSVSSRYFEPVTVPTPPQNEILAKRRSSYETVHLTKSQVRIREKLGVQLNKINLPGPLSFSPIFSPVYTSQNKQGNRFNGFSTPRSEERR